MITHRPVFGIATVPNAWTFDTSISSDAFRLLVLLHADTVEEVTEDADLRLLLGWSHSRLDAAYRDLERGGYLVRTVSGDWQLAR